MKGRYCGMCDCWEEQPDVQLLAWAVTNCHMLARRALAKSTSVSDREKWEHVLRICEKAGARSKGVLRAAVPTEITEAAPSAVAVPQDEILAIVRRHRLHIQQSSEIGEQVRGYALAVCDDILAEVDTALDHGASAVVVPQPKTLDELGYWSKALDLCADELSTCTPERFEEKRDKFVAILRNAAFCYHRPNDGTVLDALKWAERNLAALVTEDEGSGAFIRGTGTEIAGFDAGMEVIRVVIARLTASAVSVPDQTVVVEPERKIVASAAASAVAVPQGEQPPADETEDIRFVNCELYDFRRAASAVAISQEWKCKARASTDPPQDCDWPMCGCDPQAEKVIDALQESGHLASAVAVPSAREALMAGSDACFHVAGENERSAKNTSEALRSAEVWRAFGMKLREVAALDRGDTK